MVFIIKLYKDSIRLKYSSKNYLNYIIKPLQKIYKKTKTKKCEFQNLIMQEIVYKCI